MFTFSWIFELKFRWFLDRFLDSKRKHRFCKNSAPACTGARFLRFEGIRNQQKINNKSMQNKNEKMIGKNIKKFECWDGFGKGFGRVWEGLGGIKIRWKKSFNIRGRGARVPIAALGRNLYRGGLLGTSWTHLAVSWLLCGASRLHFGSQDRPGPRF